MIKLGLWDEEDIILPRPAVRTLKGKIALLYAPDTSRNERI